MKISIIGFGIIKDFFKGPRIEIELEANSSIHHLKMQLEKLYPGVKQLHSYLVAVNEEYAEDSYLLSANDEIAIIPPVSGG